ncbi:peptidase domain-containing ABC transporter [Prochlorothrix hollandica]|uniref:Peptidase C39 n=1 Tax=Prochlorothrix hollandica PCC 9006 = CALU 1027 TaxID=317619 RepID=A0A0M2Q1W9_PROHO|nr:peptidase domain-containing ABC transporter [Prochlorothrix hollandica]KKJ01293.1 peptidase C39 [Prochlorothrix hollandica PCC 9006 = CALU 1027]
MTHTNVSIQGFLSKTPPFDQLPTAALTDLVGQLKLLRYRMGQPILQQDTLPYQVAIVLSGKARLLGYDPHTQTPFPLQLLEQGSVLGWSGLVRQAACETAIASEETICITLPAQNFLQCLNRYPQLATAFEDRVSPAEVCSLLSQFVKQQARNTLNLKQLTLETFSQVQVKYLIPKRAAPVLDPEFTWFVSSDNNGGVALGTVMDGETAGELLPTLPRSLRLVGFPSFLLSPSVEDSPPAAEPVVLEAELVEESLDIPYAPDRPPAPDLDASYLPKAQDQRFPHVRGKGELGGTLACFQMLAQHLEIPFRRDSIRRVLADQLHRTGSLSLSLCGAVAEMMGIKAQLVTVPSSALSRLEAPALVRWQDGFAVLYSTSAKELVLGVPELGIIRRKPAVFEKTWGETGDVLLLRPTRATPSKTFGLQWFWPSIQQYGWTLAIVLLASFFIQLFGLANPLIIQVIIDRVIVQNSTDSLQVLGIFLLVVALFEALLTYLRTYLFVDTTNRIDMALGSEIIDHLLRLPLRYFDKRPVGELSSRVNELERIRQFLTGTALTVVLDVIFSLIYVVVLLFYSPSLTAATLATIPVFLLLTAIFSPIIQRQLRTKAEENARTQSHLVEVISGIQTVKAQNIELNSRWKWQQRYARYVSAGFKTVQTATASSAASNMLNKISALIVLWYGAYLVLDQQLTLGQLIAFRIIAGYVTGPILRLAQVWQNFQETALSLERLSDIVDTPQEATVEERRNIPMPPIRGHVHYENVSFRFQNSNKPILVNLNLEFAPGTFVGVVGQSGSGKSTLMKLLPRLYDAEAGRILIDQYDVTKVELYSLRRQVGIVPQDSLLFEGTIEENLLLTNPNVSMDEMIAAAKVAVAHDFIMELPGGYNSPIGEKGSTLSGGQRQRLAIARTVLQNPRILIMDEATSALDYDTERQVSTNLMERFHDRTVFFITHRLSTIRNAQTIVVMDKGAAVELGTHSELMAQRGRYYCLYQQQEALV